MIQSLPDSTAKGIESLSPAIQSGTTNSVANTLVQKLWNFCNLLRDVGLSYGDYLQQITTLLFLKMAHERTLVPYFQESIVPADLAWPTLIAIDGDALQAHYRHVLEELGRKPGTLGVIFRGRKTRFSSPLSSSA